jgi:hypothetical protein
VANSLLDFVMSLVRDPEAAAQYAANPAQAIADANLSDVTSADVNHLIPVVAESMSTAVPAGGLPASADTLLDSAHNVWASGAATAAFDAFDDHLPTQGSDIVADHVPVLANVIEQPEDAAPTIVDRGFDGFDDVNVPTLGADADPSPGLDVPAFQETHPADPSTGDAFDDGHHSVPDHLAYPQDPDFDIFT